MALHWTYQAFEPEDDLQQGDILLPTPALGGLFSTYDPYFGRPQYLAFMVLTQSCDLARRGDRACSASYVSIGVVRSLSEVLHRLLETECREAIPGVRGAYRACDKERAQWLLGRILNQNEQKLGLFYLYPDSAIGLAEDAVAFLRISVAFKSEHYGRLCEARRGRLAPDFQSKLGWLVGNLYSRVGTRDWEEAEMRQLIKLHLDPPSDETETCPPLLWLKPDQIARVTGQEDTEAATSVEDVSRILGMHPETRPDEWDRMVRRIGNILAQSLPNASQEEITRFEARLKNDPAVKAAFSRGR